MPEDYDAPDRTPAGIELSPDGTWYIDDIERIKTGSDIPHGVDGHTGFRCLPCAYDGIDPHPVYDPASSHDRFQDDLLEWNEECDSMVQQHLIHCNTALDKCNKGHYPMPDRPTIIVERLR